MNEEQRIFDLIEKYHQGILSKDEKTFVEKRMQTDAAFAEYLSLHGFTNQLVEAAGFDMLREKMTQDLIAIDKKNTRLKWGTGILATLLVLSSLVYVTNYFRKKNIPNRIEHKQDSPVKTQEGKDTTTSTTKVVEKIQVQKKGHVLPELSTDSVKAIPYFSPTQKDLLSNTKQEIAGEEKKTDTKKEALVKENKQCNLSFHLIVQASCKGEQSGTISVEKGTAMGGIKPYYFLTSVGERSSSGNFSNLGKGNYTITMFDSEGCSASQDILLSERNCFSRKAYSFNPDYGEKWNADQESGSGNFTIYNRGGIVIFKGHFAENNPAEWYGTNTQGTTMEAGLYVCVLEYSEGKTETIEISVIR